MRNWSLFLLFSRPPPGVRSTWLTRTTTSVSGGAVAPALSVSPLRSCSPLQHRPRDLLSESAPAVLQRPRSPRPRVLFAQELQHTTPRMHPQSDSECFKLNIKKIYLEDLKQTVSVIACIQLPSCNLPIQNSLHFF